MTDNIRTSRRPRKKTLKAQAREAIRSLIINMSALILVLGLSFFWVTNSQAQKGNTLDQLKNESEALLLESQRLNSQITQAAALSKIEEKEKVSQMTTEKEKSYVNPDDNIVGFNE